MPLRDMQELSKLSPAGIYAFSQTKPGKGRNLIKIGRTLSARSRLNGYHLCYNDGFYILAWLPLNAIIFDLRLKQTRKNALVWTKKLEARVFKLLEGFNVKTSTRTFRSEWFRISMKELHAVLNQTYREFEEICTQPWLQVWFSPPVDPAELQEAEDLDSIATRPEPPSYMPHGVSERSGRVLKTPKRFENYEFFV